MTLKTAILSQRRPRLWLGWAKSRVQRVQSYYGLVSLLLLLITTYTVREAQIRQYIPGFNFGWLLAIGVMFIVAVGLIDYKLVHPSEIAYNQSQLWKHESPVRRELGRLEESINQANGVSATDLEELKSSIDSLRRSIDTLNENSKRNT